MNNSNQINQHYDHVFKLLILGDTAVGKTTFLLRASGELNQQKLLNTISTLGVDLKTVICTAGNQTCRLNIWDTAGQERFHNISKMSYQKADGIILCYSISDRQTFTGIVEWMKQIMDSLNNKKVPILLIGNKLDLSSQRVVEVNEGLLLAKNFNVKIFETSAMTGQNVSDCIQYITQQLIQQKNINDKVTLEEENSEELQFKIHNQKINRSHNVKDKSCNCH